MAAAAAAIWVIPEQAAPGDDGEIAPVLLPIVAAVVIAIFAIIQALSNALGRAAEPVDFDTRSVLFSLVAVAALAAAVGLFAWFGFRIGGAMAIAAIGLAMRPPLRIAGWLIAVAIVLPLAAYTLAWHGLRLALP
ncbi:MAG: hypothetical protein GKR94_34260 [Gammaproteobacteria bacterium]|nr:hypothetical protein [Gammaproteobacteria bacterium]